MNKISNKIKIPTKTKIAAWMMILYGLFWIGVILLFFAKNELSLEVVAALFGQCLYLVIAYLLLKIKKWSWILAIIFLLNMVLDYSLGFKDDLVSGDWGMILIKSIGTIVPLFFLLIDRKNYFEAMKKAKKEDGDLTE